jgi:hypothetical protein
MLQSRAHSDSESETHASQPEDSASREEPAVTGTAECGDVTPPRKKAKRLVHNRPDWQKDFSWLNSVKNNKMGGGIKLNVAKADLCFVSNLCKVFEQTVLTLENDAVTVCDVFPAMAAMRTKLKDRLTDRFFGSEASAIIESEDMPEKIARKIETNFCDALQRGVSYLEQWFDFSDNSITHALQKLSLSEMPTFQHVKNACTALKITGRIDMDALYDEFSTSKEALQRIMLCDKSVGEKWQDLFKCMRAVPNTNLFQLVSYVLSVPASNAFPERIFSLMNSKWQRDKNRMSVALVKAELLVFTNYDLDCREFYSFVIGDRNILDAAAGNAKYDWKKRAVTASAKC